MGCATSKAAPPPPLSEVFARKVTIEHYGVLGHSNSKRGRAEPPDHHTIFADPCSVRFVWDPHLHPGQAGGASGAIYEHIGISGDQGFPPDVKAAIKGEGDVAYHQYGYPKGKHVLHCVGFDFRSYSGAEPLSPDVARGLLADLYGKMFALAAKYGRGKIRLVPISAGIFSGPLHADMPQITADALLDAIAFVFGPDADATRTTYVADVEAVELCVYMEQEYSLYSAAWGKALAARAFARPTSEPEPEEKK